MIQLTIPVDPTPKGRPRLSIINGKPVIYTPKKTKSAEKAMRNYAILMHKNPPTENPIIVNVNYFFKRPKTVKRRHHSVKPDLDNLNKTLDAFNGVLWKDDAQIVNLISGKFYTESDGYIEIKITEIN